MDIGGTWLIKPEPEPVNLAERPQQKDDQADTGAIPVPGGRYKGKTAAQWRESAITEGQKWHKLCATVADHDGIMEFPALFTLTGALVPEATWVKTKRGKWVWRIGNGRDVSWFDPSRALSGARRRANDAAKGYRIGSVRTRAQVADASTIHGQYHYICRVDNAPVEIIDNGTLGTAYQDW